ncbi:MAG: response regulator, partial [Verrucomicrobia bacterium]|nr:response regulator [Verrucomicrobiota bacterium]
MSSETGSGSRRLAKAKSVLLIATDDAISRQWAQEIKEWGYAVEYVAESDPGLDKIFDVGYDAVLLDFSGPQINGLAALEEIRAEEMFKNLFIGVFVQDHGKNAEQETAATAAGANRIFRRAETSADAIITALKTALFPRVYQVQPRTRQSPPRGDRKDNATFTPRINVEPVASGARPASIPMPAGLQPTIESGSRTGATAKKILIIEDNETLAGVYRSQLESAGYEVEVALDGVTGFHDLLTIEPSVLLLDVFLPGMGGLDIIRKTRSQRKFEKLPILVFTSNFSRELEAEAREAGVTRLFDKATSSAGEIIHYLNELFFPAATAGRTQTDSGAHGRGGNQHHGQQQQKAIRLTNDRASAESAPAPAKPSAPDPKKDDALKMEIREALLQDSPDTVKALRHALGQFLRAQAQGDAAARQQHLLDLQRRIHTLIGNAAIAGLSKMARLCSALDALLREFQDRPESINASTQRTLTQAIDFMAQLFTRSGSAENDPQGNERILVVDDEVISRRVIGHSLEKAALKPTAVDHPQAALDLLEKNAYDLIFLDVEMPDMNGFELCKKLRVLPLHAKTPVIFVTALSGFDSRVKSS